jgi:hypothetical protein
LPLHAPRAVADVRPLVVLDVSDAALVLHPARSPVPGTRTESGRRLTPRRRTPRPPPGRDAARPRRRWRIPSRTSARAPEPMTARRTGLDPWPHRSRASPALSPMAQGHNGGMRDLTPERETLDPIETPPATSSPPCSSSGCGGRCGTRTTTSRSTARPSTRTVSTG